MTLTETIRKGIIADGWTPVESKSGKECFTKTQVAQEGIAQLWIWLGGHGSVRIARQPAVGGSVPVSKTRLAKWKALGEAK